MKISLALPAVVLRVAALVNRCADLCRWLISPRSLLAPARTKTLAGGLAALLGMSATASAATRISESLALSVIGTISARTDDNIFLNDIDAVEDTLFDVTPGLELTFGHGSQTTGSLELAETFTRYLDNDSLDEELLSAVLRAVRDDSKLKLSVHASYRELSQSTRDVRSTALVRRDVLNASAGSTLSFSRKSSANLRLTWDDIRYDDPLHIDSEEATLPLNYYYALSEKLDLSTGIRFRQTSLAANSGDSKDYYYNVGARIPVSEKLSGFFSIGFNQRKPDTGDDESGVGAEAQFHYEATGKTALTLSVANDYTTSADGISQKIFAISPALKTEFSSQWEIAASVSYQQIDYFSGRSDAYFDGHLGLTYRISNQATIGASYRHRSNDSDLTFTDSAGRSRSAGFDNNIISFTATLRL